MAGYIDLHTHLLPALDDGAKDLAETGEILNAAAENGFARLAATPHRIDGVYNATNAQIDEAVEEVTRSRDGGSPDLVPGAEYYLDDRFMAMLEDGPLRCLGESNTVLVELPMMRLPPYAGDIAFKIRLKGYVPLLAHPERYNDILRKPKQARELVEKGYLLQINLGSLAGMYGRRVLKAARFLIEDGLVAVAASDIHSKDHCQSLYRDGVGSLGKIAGKSGVEELLDRGPARLLASDYDE